MGVCLGAQEMVHRDSGFGSQLLAELVHRDELFVAGPFPFRVVFRSGCRLSAVCWRWVDVQAKP